MIKKYLHPNKSKGFTLIELLIVIAIIGILAAVLIAVINPVKQQNKAKDAGIQATINKMALAVNAFNSAYARWPTCAELMGELNGASNTWNCGATNQGSIRLANISTAPKCQSGNYMRYVTDINYTATCDFLYYYSGADACISTGSFGVNEYFKWQSNGTGTGLSLTNCRGEG